MTLIGSEEKLTECCTAVQAHVNKCVVTKDCGGFPLHTWNQEEIASFYRLCCEKQVLPELILPDNQFKLSGSKEQVHEIEIEFYRLKYERAEEAHVSSFALIANWKFETENNNFQPYSSRLNAQIEMASQKKQKSVRIIKYNIL